MKQLIDFRCYVSVNGEEYCDTSIWKQWRYLDTTDGDCHEELIADWETAYKAIEEHLVWNATVGTTWKKEPCIIIHYGDLYRNDVKFTAKTFHRMKYKWVYEPVEEIYNIKDLADRLPAEQFCEWLKDQGMSINIGG